MPVYADTTLKVFPFQQVSRTCELYESENVPRKRSGFTFDYIESEDYGFLEEYTDKEIEEFFTILKKMSTNRFFCLLVPHYFELSKLGRNYNPPPVLV